MSHNRSFRWSDEQRTITLSPLLGNSSLDYLEREDEHPLKRSDLACVGTVNQQEVGNEPPRGTHDAPRFRRAIPAIPDGALGTDKLFSPFFSTKAKGQGLGLAVCKRLVEAQGGTITVKSKPRKGTAFTIKMPRGRKEVAS
jgi:hypothetical protein